MSIVTLTPGLLVSLHTRMEGGVHYTRVDLDAKTSDTEAQVERWETTKVVADPEEHARATKVRNKCSSLIRGVCTHSSFGLLCPSAKEADLDQAIQEARALADAFNATSRTAQVSVYALKGRIAETDSEAARAISSEIRDLLTSMEDGIKAADPAAIREAANRAKKIGSMLDENTARKVTRAVEEARSAARAIVKRVEAEGEEAALVVQELSRKAIEEARFSFLDLDTPATPVAPSPMTERAVEVEMLEEEETEKAVTNLQEDEGDKLAAAPFVARKLEV